MVLVIAGKLVKWETRQMKEAEKEILVIHLSEPAMSPECFSAFVEAYVQFYIKAIIFRAPSGG